MIRNSKLSKATISLEFDDGTTQDLVFFADINSEIKFEQVSQTKTNDSGTIFQTIETGLCDFSLELNSVRTRNVNDGG